MFFLLGRLNGDNLIGFAFLAILSTIVAKGMHNFALGRMQSSTMAAFGGISTFVTIGVGMALGGEVLETYHIVGLVFILARMIGVSYIAIKRDRQRLKLQAETKTDEA